MKKKLIFLTIAVVCTALIVGTLFAEAGKLREDPPVSSEPENTACESSDAPAEILSAEPNSDVPEDDSRSPVPEEPQIEWDAPAEILSAEPNSDVPEDDSRDPVPEEPQIEWDFEKGWDVFAGFDGPVMLIANTMVYKYYLPDLVGMQNCASRLGMKLLYDVSIHVKAMDYKDLSEEEAAEALEKIHGIGVPLTYCEKTETYHAYLSLQDVHRLGEWGERNGYRIWGSHCDCGDAAEHERAVILPGNFDYPME